MEYIVHVFEMEHLATRTMGLKYVDRRIGASSIMLTSHSSIETSTFGAVCPKSKRKGRMPYPLFRRIRSLGVLLLCLAHLVLLEKVPLVSSSIESPHQQCMLVLLQADENQDNLLTMKEFLAALSYLSRNPECPPPHSSANNGGFESVYKDPSLSAFVEAFYALSCLCSVGVPRTAASEPLCCSTTRDENTTLRIPTASDPDAYLDILCWSMHSVLNEQCVRDSVHDLPSPTTDTPDRAAEQTTTFSPTFSPSAVQNPVSPTDPSPMMQAVEAEVTTQPTPTPVDPVISNDDSNVSFAPSMAPTTFASRQELQQEEKVEEEQSNSTAAEMESSSSPNNATPKGNVDNGITLTLSLALTVFCFCLCAATLYWRYRVRSLSRSAGNKKHHRPSNGTNELPTRELSASVSNSTDSPGVEAGTDDKVNQSFQGSVSQVGP